MSGYLFPRLSPERAAELVERAQSHGIEQLARGAARTRVAGEAFSVLGRPNVDDERLLRIGRELREIATRFGYPAIARRARTKFDIEAAIHLHENLPAARGELLRSEVWQYFSCALAPDIVCWRWRLRDGQPVNPEHFEGGVRDCFGRLWRRADVLKDPRLADPWTHVRALGEDNVVAIIERPKVARHRILVREAARAFLLRRSLARKSSADSAEEELLRQMMLRLTRRGAHVAYSALAPVEVVAAVAEVADATLRSLGVSPVSQAHLASQNPELALSRPS